MSESNMATREESMVIVSNRSDLIATLVKMYPTMGAALTSLSGGNGHYKVFQEAGLKVPMPGVLMQALGKAYQGIGTATTDGRRELEDAREYRTFVGTQNEATVHFKESRKTERVTVEPADVISKMVGDSERLRPGFTRFVGQLVSVYDNTAKEMKMWSNESTMAAVKPVPYTYLQIATFLLEHRDKLHVPPPAQTTPMNVVRLLVERIAALPIVEYLELTTAFILTMLNMTEQNIVLRTGVPVAQIGTVRIDGVPFFQHVSTRGVTKERAKYYLYFTGTWKVSAVPPTTLREAFDRLISSRAHRREDKSGYSSVTRGHAEGGDLPDMRIDVTRVIGLVLPLLEAGKRVDVRTTSPEVAQHVYKYLTDRKDSNVKKLRFVMEASKAVAAFTLDLYKDITVTTRTPGTMFVDMVSTAIPTVAKTEDASQKCANYMTALVPTKPFISYMKAFDRAPEVYNVFKFGSSHSFDFIVSSESQVEVAGVKVTLSEGKLQFEDERVPLLRINTPQELVLAQFRDDRRKLELYTSMRNYTEYSTMINLWSPPPFFSKRMKSRIVTQVTEGDGDDVQMVVFDVISEENEAPAPAASKPEVASDAEDAETQKLREDFFN